MKKVQIRANFDSSLERVWNIVTDNQRYEWRSDLSKVEVSADGKTFVEFTQDGFPTTFTITVKKYKERYEFDMKNKNMSGHWMGIFSENEGGTQIIFIEEVEVSHPVMKFFVGGYLKKQQERYIADLKTALGE